MSKKIGKQTVRFDGAPYIKSMAAVVGPKEGEGPLKECFDEIVHDAYLGAVTWEAAETLMLQKAFNLACQKGHITANELDYILSGDLLNQCVSSAFAAKDTGTPYIGLYGACSTMAEGLGLGAMLVDGGFANTVCAVTGSHFCSAERQFRFPLEYGGVRTPTAQRTVTGAGAVILSKTGSGARITHATVGKICDKGLTDANNMGACMAPAAFDTIMTHFNDTGRGIESYDAVFTGDLGAVGHDILERMLEEQGVYTGAKYMDCGVLIYDLRTQNVNSGGSGCGCCASVLAGHILPAMERGVWNRVLVAATGALMSPTSAQQSASIPAICHAITIENEVK